MITDGEVNALLNYNARQGVAISLYLNGDTRNKDSRDIEIKDLIKNARKDLSNLNIDRACLQSAEENLEHIRDSVLADNSPSKYKAIAVFSNSAENFHRIYRLPIHVKSRLVIDTTFYVRPLVVLLEEHSRIGVVLIDSRHARFFEVYVGEILEHIDFSTAAKSSKTPLLETFMKREKRLAQKKEEEVRRHFSLVADLLKTHFLKGHFDRLIIGAKKPLGDHFARALYPKLHKDLIGISEIDIHAKEGEILAMVLSIEKEYELHEENKLLRRIMNETEKDGYAVRGLKRVIEAAQDYSLQTLAVADDFTQPGFVCSACGMPHFSADVPEGKGKCVSCGEQLIEVSDVVDQVVDAAASQNAIVRHVQGTDLIASLENIAAIIKFRKGEFVKMEEAVETES
jgi:peptide chain release factor subunit 1